ncbi:RAMP superfamily CRISPR-associated protein [Laspinema sp. D1]|uniref:RAMP superfamily CRISPR-associated protein n=1 Tax=Laspinema palackyanum D2a TaxID=2953684 RepID=A0ABT2MK36_9CYAN|nr:RAMP superfamily CRISPR-associated protein [Laspinema sp. D2a]
MTTTPKPLLPTKLPDWYTVSEKEKGWTPTTDDFKKPAVENAWEKTAPPASKRYTIRVTDLQIISPVQVGGGSFPEGHILPARIAGVPCIPGSSVRGVLLNWLKDNWNEISDPKEQEFWESLIDRREGWHWRPREIRFENVPLIQLKPYPLHPQQNWQLYGEDSLNNQGNQTNRTLASQWQAAPKHPKPEGTQPIAIARVQSENPVFQISLKKPASGDQKNWLEKRLKQMLEQHGIGRGTSSGFGRLAVSVPQTGTWTIELTGMKPYECDQTRKYRWTPQVLRATLRGYFTRLALPLLGKPNAERLTNILFGGISSRNNQKGCIAELSLTSFLSKIRPSSPDHTTNYRNIPTEVAHETWVILVNHQVNFKGKNCPVEQQNTVAKLLKPLIENLLSLASRVGGLGPGWRRHPHKMEKIDENGPFYLYRGSKFTVNPASSQPLANLIQKLNEIIKKLAIAHNVPLNATPNVPGQLISIWQGERKKWRSLVHGVCSSDAPNRSERPWCGDSKTRPSGYAVREYDDFCWITVFDSGVVDTLNEQGFNQIWPLSTS